MKTHSSKEQGPLRRTLHRAVNSWKLVIFLYTGAVLVSALIFSITESRSYGDSLWWAFITALTIGYGDIFPATMVGRITGVVLAHFVVLVVAPIVIAHLTLRLVEDADAFTDKEQRELMSGQDDLLRQVGVIMDHLGLEDPGPATHDTRSH